MRMTTNAESLETPTNPHDSGTVTRSRFNGQQQLNLENELDHLLRRIKHVQESIQLSSQSTALFNPQTWQENCLFAVRNCVFEYRQIIKYYNISNDVRRESGNGSNHADVASDDYTFVNGNEHYHESNGNANYRMDSHTIAPVTLKIFGLIQMAIQVGPLKASNPGYFKRCGADVAKQALVFLRQCTIGLHLQQDLEKTTRSAIGNQSNDNNNIIAAANDDRNGLMNVNNNDGIVDDNDDMHESLDIHLAKLKELQFTDKQCNIILKWIANAEKAVVSNQAPSKSALKLQASSVSKKSQRKKKFQKKKKKK